MNPRALALKAPVSSRITPRSVTVNPTIKEIPQRRMLYLIYFGASFIFIIISLLFLTQLFVIIGVLSFFVLLFFYLSGSIYTTYKTLGIIYFNIKKSSQHGFTLFISSRLKSPFQ